MFFTLTDKAKYISISLWFEIRPDKKENNKIHLNDIWIYIRVFLPLKVCSSVSSFLVAEKHRYVWQADWLEGLLVVGLLRRKEVRRAAASVAVRATLALLRRRWRRRWRSRKRPPPRPIVVAARSAACKHEQRGYDQERGEFHFWLYVLYISYMFASCLWSLFVTRLSLGVVFVEITSIYKRREREGWVRTCPALGIYRIDVLLLTKIRKKIRKKTIIDNKRLGARVWFYFHFRYSR